MILNLKTSVRTAHRFMAGSMALFAGVLGLLLPMGAFAVETLDCQHKEGGRFLFGEAPFSCDAYPFGDVTRIKYIYPEITFDISRNRDEGYRREYVTNIHAIIRDIADDYIRRRKPGVKDVEAEQFVRAILTTAAQESVFGHFRIGNDRRLKIMIGNSIDLGLMQINQKYHAAKGSELSFDLINNVMLGIEQYYREWERAKDLSCVLGPKPEPEAKPGKKADAAKNDVKNDAKTDGNGKTDGKGDKKKAVAKKKPKPYTAAQIAENRLRAAYSAYNGGSGNICRFANGGATWARNDKGWLEKFNKRPWLPYVSDDQRKPVVNIKCLLEGDDLCAVADEYRVGYLRERPLITNDGYTCVSSDGHKLDCARDRRVFACIANLSPEILSAKPMMFEKQDTSDMEVIKHRDRNQVCAHAAPGLVLVGGFVKMVQDTKVRSNIGGKQIASTKAGQVFQVLDYEVKLGSKTERYYKIRIDEKIAGYVYGGNESDHGKFAVEANRAASKAAALHIPREGSVVEVVRKGGLSLKNEPGDKAGQLAMVPAKSKLTVSEVVTLDTANELWLRVQVGGQKGFIYGGRTYPTVTVGEWIKVVK